MKPTTFAAPCSLALAAALGGTFFAPAAFAQDDPTRPPGEPTSPWQAPSGAEAPAASPAPEAPATGAVPPESTAPPGSTTVPKAGASPALVYEKPQPDASAAQDHQQKHDEGEEPDDGKLRHHQDHWVGFLGFRVAKISSPGFDPFADSDELAQFSVGAGRTVMTAGNFSIAALFMYDVGGRANEARGAQSDITVHRLTVGGEGRYHFFRQLFVFGRVAPGAIHSIAKLEEPSTSAESLGARNWVFATDLSAGAMFEFTGLHGGSRKRRPNAWITFEGGYGFAGESELSLTSDGGGPQRAEPLELGPLALGGPFMRAGFVLTY